MYSENQLMLSRKQVGEEALDWVKNNLEVGMTLNGIVKNIRKFGAFVEIGGGIVGLLRIEDISVSRIKSPEERLNIGQKINVMVKSIDRTTGRIILSYKELLGNWEENIKDYKEKMIVDGIVKEADKYKNGIFIELKPNLVGLAEYKEGFYYGQKVKVFIKKIIEDKKKIKLVIMGG
jgi:small subunit ribosomal protein S1